MCDEPGVQEVPDVGGVAAARIRIVIRDEPAKLRGVALLRRGFGGIDECANFVLGGARGSACGGGIRVFGGGGGGGGGGFRGAKKGAWGGGGVRRLAVFEPGDVGVGGR